MTTELHLERQIYSTATSHKQELLRAPHLPEIGLCCEDPSSGTSVGIVYMMAIQRGADDSSSRLMESSRSTPLMLLAKVPLGVSCVANGFAPRPEVRAFGAHRRCAAQDVALMPEPCFQ